MVSRISFFLLFCFGSVVWADVVALDSEGSVYRVGTGSSVRKIASSSGKLIWEHDFGPDVIAAAVVNTPDRAVIVAGSTKEGSLFVAKLTQTGDVVARRSFAEAAVSEVAAVRTDDSVACTSRAQPTRASSQQPVELTSERRGAERRPSE